MEIVSKMVVLPTNFLRKRGGKNGDISEAGNADNKETADRYADAFKNLSDEERRKRAGQITNEYYDLATDFYEWGWGQCFHFAPRFKSESFWESILRHEHFLAAKGGFKYGDKVLDLGCGVGGPLRNITKMTGAKVIGVNNNQYQITRAKSWDKKNRMEKMTDYIKADFNSIDSVKDGTMDGAYSIEAVCHAGDKVTFFKEIFRTLKPGACFVMYDWVVTDKFDLTNAEHRKIAHGIELGDGLPPLVHHSALTSALKEAGFEIEEAFDQIEAFEKQEAELVPWYDPLVGNYSSIFNFRATPFGRWCTHKMVGCMETLKLAPLGTSKTSSILQEAATYLVKGGQTGTFTPAYFVKARKPLKKSQ